MMVKHKPEITPEPADKGNGLLALALLSLPVGAASGLLGTAFRLALEQADRFRDQLIAWAHGERLVGFLLTVGVSAAATAIAAWLVRRFSPQATGSGIPMSRRWQGVICHRHHFA